MCSKYVFGKSHVFLLVRLTRGVKRIKYERVYLPSASVAAKSATLAEGQKSSKDDLPMRIAAVTGSRLRSFRLLLRVIP